MEAKNVLKSLKKEIFIPRGRISRRIQLAYTRLQTFRKDINSVKH